jgi:hypothetical protein
LIALGTYDAWWALNTRLTLWAFKSSLAFVTLRALWACHSLKARQPLFSLGSWR